MWCHYRTQEGIFSLSVGTVVFPCLSAMYWETVELLKVQQQKMSFKRRDSGIPYVNMSCVCIGKILNC
jgi:hypothetical protein